MAYGIQIFNSAGRKVIDSTELTPNLQFTNGAASAYSAMAYPPSGYVVGDLIIARPVNNPVYETGGYVPIAAGTASRFYGSQTSANSQNFQNTAGIHTALLKKQSVGISGPAPGEYGFDVYSSDGSTILFSATRATGATVLAVGTASLGQSITYTPPSSLTFNKIYAVVNGSSHSKFPGVSGQFSQPSFFIECGYHFYPALSTPKIVVQHKLTYNGSNLTGPGTFTYMLIYDPN